MYDAWISVFVVFFHSLQHLYLHCSLLMETALVSNYFDRNDLSCFVIMCLDNLSKRPLTDNLQQLESVANVVVKYNCVVGPFVVVSVVPGVGHSCLYFVCFLPKAPYFWVVKYFGLFEVCKNLPVLSNCSCGWYRELFHLRNRWVIQFTVRRSQRARYSSRRRQRWAEARSLSRTSWRWICRNEIRFFRWRLIDRSPVKLGLADDQGELIRVNFAPTSSLGHRCWGEFVKLISQALSATFF
jgi:hypothetical protein